LILASTATSLAQRDGVQNALTSIGISPQFVVSLDQPETEFSAARQQFNDVPTLLVVSVDDLVLRAAQAHCDLEERLVAALSAATNRRSSPILVVLVGEPPLPLVLPDDIDGLVDLTAFPDVTNIDAHELISLLGLTPDSRTTTQDNSTEKDEVEHSALRSDSLRHNTPPATYLHYIHRDILAQVEDSLSTQQPITAVTGLGGVGKSSLAREIANRTARRQNSLPFTLIVWTSDKPDPGSTTLSRLIDQIAETIDFPGLKSMPADDKVQRATRILQDQPVLLIVDNLETVQDQALLNWLAKVPDPSRLLITTREEQPAFTGVQRTVMVTGFDLQAAKLLVEQASEKLGISHSLRPEDIKRLWRVSAGNATAIEVAVGLAAVGGQSLEAVIQDIRHARDPLFTDLFDRSWSTLTADDRKILYAMDLVPYGATSDLLSVIATGKVGQLTRSLNHLRSMALLDRSVLFDHALNENVTLFSMNPLVQAFVRAKRATDKSAIAIKTRAIKHARLVASSAGFCPADIHRLDILDKPQLLRNIESIVNWCMDEERYQDAISITRDTRYYYYVRGVWSPDPNPNLIRATAARRIGDESEELDALLYYCNIAAKQENLDALEQHLPRLEQLVSGLPARSQSVLANNHVTALIALAKEEYDTAISLWTSNLSAGDLTEESISANMRWLGVAHFRASHLEKARSVFSGAISHDQRMGFSRALLASRLYLIRIALMEADHLRPAEPTPSAELEAEARDDLNGLATEIEDLHDELYKAEWLELSGQLALAVGDRREAIDLLERSAEMFERIGLSKRTTGIAATIAQNV
jgi:hypothetical protein